MFISSQVIRFKELVYNRLKMDSRQLKKYEKFPVGGLYTDSTQISEEEKCNLTAQTSVS
jgi:hypothetical protein